MAAEHSALARWPDVRCSGGLESPYAAHVSVLSQGLPRRTVRIEKRAGRLGAPVLLACLAAACLYDPVVPDNVVVCHQARDCPASFQCVPLAGQEPPRSVCCRHCNAATDVDAASAPDAPEHPRDVPLEDTRPSGGEVGGDTGEHPDGDAPDSNPGMDAREAGAPDVRAPFDVPDNGCPRVKGGPALVQMGGYCIDETEVTNAQYLAFWTEKHQGSDVAGQIPACSWNTSFTPDMIGPPAVPWPPPAGTERRPVVEVNWCDAYAFCQWAGKRLCGKIGGGRLPKWESAESPALSQWTKACAGDGTGRPYPYGKEYDVTACNVQRPAESVNSLVDVASLGGCRTPQGVYDLSGNVEEWLDACTGDVGENDECAVAGGSAYHQPVDNLTCTGSEYGVIRFDHYVMRGFRCCAP
jgi:sulfatase modifying factor 1